MIKIHTYAQCKGAHCRCMNLGGMCKNYHYADCETCPKNQTTPKDERTWEERFDELFGAIAPIHAKPAIKKFIRDLLHTHQSALAEEMVKKLEANGYISDDLAGGKAIELDCAQAIIRRHLTPDNHAS